MIYTFEDLTDKNAPKALKNNKWVMARPVNYQLRNLKEKIYAAWQVFIGKADAFYWPEGQ
jgi:hypothetical protein